MPFSEGMSADFSPDSSNNSTSNIAQCVFYNEDANGLCGLHLGDEYVPLAEENDTYKAFNNNSYSVVINKMNGNIVDIVSIKSRVSIIWLINNRKIDISDLDRIAAADERVCRSKGYTPLSKGVGESSVPIKGVQCGDCMPVNCYRGGGRVSDICNPRNDGDYCRVSRVGVTGHSTMIFSPRTGVIGFAALLNQNLEFLGNQ
jgi:hypothetical protein